MGTQFKELIRQTLFKLQRVDGEAILAAEQAINEAQKNIARVRDFDELMTLDITHAFTVISQKSYHITTDLALVRPKDIYSIRYMDEEESRKLDFVPFREIDEKIPYTEIFAIGKPKWYTRRGKYIELFRIPDAVKPLYIMHSQWPSVLTSDTDETPYENLDDVITTLSADIATAMLEQTPVSNWFERTKQLLGVSLNEEDTRPDTTHVAQPFNPAPRVVLGKYWESPWVKEQPD